MLLSGEWSIPRLPRMFLVGQAVIFQLRKESEQREQSEMRGLSERDRNPEQIYNIQYCRGYLLFYSKTTDHSHCSSTPVAMLSFINRGRWKAPLVASCGYMHVKPRLISFFSKSECKPDDPIEPLQPPQNVQKDSNLILKMRKLWSLDNYSRKLLEDLVDTAQPGSKNAGVARAAQIDTTADSATGATVPSKEKSIDKSLAALLSELDSGVKKFISDVSGKALGTEAEEDEAPALSKQVSADILDIIPSSVLDDESKGTLRVLTALGDRILSQIKQSSLNWQHPFLINVGLLRLYTLQAQLKQRPSTGTQDKILTEHFLAEAKHFLRFAAEVYRDAPYIAVEDIILDKLEEDEEISKNIKIPRHVVFFDHLTRSIVVSIRGTGSVSDVLTDLHIDATPMYDQEKDSVFDKFVDQLTGQNGSKTYAHSGIKHSATALKDPIIEALNTARDSRGGKYRDYSVVFTGHSLGAGTACLLSMMVSQVVDFPVKTFAFAPPPVISREGTTDVKRSFLTGKKSSCDIYSFVLNNDVITRASHNEFLNFLTAVAYIDSLPWTPKERMVKLMKGCLTSEEISEVDDIMRNAKNSDIHKENDGVELLIPGKIFWMVPKVTGSADILSTATSEGKSSEGIVVRYEILSLDEPSKLFNGSFLTGDSMVSDHLVLSYMNSMVNLDTSSGSSSRFPKRSVNKKTNSK